MLLFKPMVLLSQTPTESSCSCGAVPHTPRPHTEASDTFRSKPPPIQRPLRHLLPCELKSRAATQETPKAAATGCRLLPGATAQAPAGTTRPSAANLALVDKYRRMAAQTVQCRVSGGDGDGGGGSGGGMRTVECLRGRLLAERVASKAAKEEADQLAKRLDELEKTLADEVKVRNKAERRLRRAIKRLESLKILDVELSDGSIGSLSSNGRSGHQAPEVEERNSRGSLTIDDSVLSGPAGDGNADRDNARDSSAGSCTQLNSPSQDGSWCSVVSEQSRPGSCMDLAGNTTNCCSKESGGDHDSERQHLDASSGCGSAKSEEAFYDSDDRLALVLVDPALVAAADGPRTQHNDTQAAELHAKTHEEDERTEEEESNKLALVLVDPQPQPATVETGSPKHHDHGDVESVLLALRRVKEQLRYTIEQRSQLVAHRELYGH